MAARVLAACRSPAHEFSKASATSVRLVAGLGVEEDCHCGETVQHRSRVAQDPTQPNLRQVHLIPSELFRELREAGFDVGPGQLGENVTTEGIALLDLPVGTRLALGSDAVVEVTGLRNPCKQIDDFRPGLLARVVDRDTAGRLIRRAGIMGVVARSGMVAPGDGITVTYPPEPHRPLDRV